MAKKMEPLLSLGWAFLQQIQFQIDYVYFAFNFDSLFPRKSDLIKKKWEPTSSWEKAGFFVYTVFNFLGPPFL